MSTDEKPKYLKSPEEMKGAPVPSYIEKMEAHVCPIFDADKGSRMETVRMRMLLTQGELSELLGVSQSIVSKLERGAVTQATFTLGRLRAVFGKHLHFILFGTGEALAWSTRHIHQKFWETKLKIRRKSGSGLWKHEQWCFGNDTCGKPGCTRVRGTPKPARKPSQEHSKFWDERQKGLLKKAFKG